jgi:hypothetical protein
MVIEKLLLIEPVFEDDMLLLLGLVIVIAVWGVM